MAEQLSFEATLAAESTQQAFGDLVGISQQAVSDLLSRSVLQPGESLGAWLLAYTSHLREQAAGRGADGELARERALLTREQRERISMENAQTRKEVAPIAVLGFALGKFAGDVAGILNGVVPKIRRRLPHVSSDVLRVVEDELVRVRARAAAVSLADADEDDDEEEA